MRNNALLIAFEPAELHKELYKLHHEWKVVWICGQRFGMFKFFLECT